MNDVIEGIVGKTASGQRSRTPARLDYLQSATGLFLALFMWAHMFFVSSILISKDFMYAVTKFFEGAWFIENGEPLIVSLAAAVVSVIFVTHAGIAARKFPVTYRQFRAYRSHMKMMKHTDTNLWFIQAVTGFSMFFLGSIHLYTVMVRPEEIGPYASADQTVGDMMWPLYILLLLAVELHGAIGLYRLCVKWGWFEGKNANETRKRLRRVMWTIAIFFTTLGSLTLATYIKIGIEHADHAGERYVPSSERAAQ
ncbi:fumarate reductase cytochrome b subunit [Thiomicrolovo sp. ZZH C-3]